MIATVKFMKLHEHTVLSLTWEGNLRKKSCSNCCTRWWIEVDGSPCSAYEEIETSIRSSTAQDISAPTTISGLCFESGDLPLASGSRQIRLMVGNCPGSFISNAGIGFFSTSRLIVDEIPRRKCGSEKIIFSFPSLSPLPPSLLSPPSLPPFFLSPLPLPPSLLSLLPISLYKEKNNFLCPQSSAISLVFNTITKIKIISIEYGEI